MPEHKKMAHSVLQQPKAMPSHRPPLSGTRETDTSQSGQTGPTLSATGCAIGGNRRTFCESYVTPLKPRDACTHHDLQSCMHSCCQVRTFRQAWSAASASPARAQSSKVAIAAEIWRYRPMASSTGKPERGDGWRRRKEERKHRRLARLGGGQHLI